MFLLYSPQKLFERIFFTVSFFFIFFNSLSSMHMHPQILGTIDLMVCSFTGEKILGVYFLVARYLICVTCNVFHLSTLPPMLLYVQ